MKIISKSLSHGEFRLGRAEMDQEVDTHTD